MVCNLSTAGFSLLRRFQILTMDKLFMYTCPCQKFGTDIQRKVNGNSFTAPSVAKKWDWSIIYILFATWKLHYTGVLNRTVLCCVYCNSVITWFLYGCQRKRDKYIPVYLTDFCTAVKESIISTFQCSWHRPSLDNFSSTITSYRSFQIRY